MKRNRKKLGLAVIFSLLYIVLSSVAIFGEISNDFMQDGNASKIIDVKTKMVDGKLQISILTSKPSFFDIQKGSAPEKVGLLKIVFPETILSWSNMESRVIEVNQGGVKEIALEQAKAETPIVQVVVKLLPLATYEVSPLKDSRGVLVEVAGGVPESEMEPLRVSLDFVNSDINHVLKVLCEESGLSMVTDSTIKGLITLHLKDVPIKEALDLILTANGLDYQEIGNSILIAPSEKINKEVSEVFKLNHIEAGAAKGMLEGVIESSKIQINEKINSIIITDLPKKVEQAREIIKNVDKPLPQVLLNAKIIELGEEAARELGFAWSESIGTTLIEQNRPLYFNEADALHLPASHRFYRVTRPALQLDLALRALETQDKAKILSNPRIVTLNGKEAEIFVGDRIPYTITTVTGGVAQTEVRFTEPGIRLKITPTVIEDDFIVAKIEPSVSYIYSWRGPNDEYPWLKTREATAELRIYDGETVILGGLLSEEDKKSITKVPILSSIPIFGELFKSRKTSSTKTELIITVTPTILKR